MTSFLANNFLPSSFSFVKLSLHLPLHYLNHIISHHITLKLVSEWRQKLTLFLDLVYISMNSELYKQKPNNLRSPRAFLLNLGLVGMISKVWNISRAAVKYPRTGLVWVSSIIHNDDPWCFLISSSCALIGKCFSPRSYCSNRIALPLPFKSSNLNFTWKLHQLAYFYTMSVRVCLLPTIIVGL